MSEGQEKMAADMLKALSDKDVKKIRELVSYGLDANCELVEQLNDGKEIVWTPLVKTASHGNVELLELLVSLGAKVDKTDKSGFSPLITAAYNGKADAVKFLVLHGADPGWSGPQNKKAIDWARDKKHTDIVLFLSEARERKQAMNDGELVLNRPLGNRVLQEVFNFHARDRITLVREGLDGKVEAMTRQNFRDIEDKDGLRAALEKFRYYGGEADDSVIDSSVSVRKGKLDDSADCKL
jgi:ankyrin repeat protein